VTKHQSFPIHSWVDLRHVCDTSNCLAFYFRECQLYFCLLLTLSCLSLKRIPHSEHISPEAMVALLSLLTSLEILHLEFEYSISPWRGKPKPASTKTLYSPRSRQVSFQRRCRIFRRPLVTFIDAPQLNYLSINFFRQIDTPHDSSNL
jgi:hypothetical protein